MNVSSIIILAVLIGDGHSVKLQQIPDRNLVELVVHGEKIFKCQMQELVFGE